MATNGFLTSRLGRTFAWCAPLFFSVAVLAQPTPVRHREGLVHGFLVLSTLDGKPLADGDLIQTASGDRVTARLLFRFKDGSTHDETTVYSQRQQFRLITDHVIQKGPTFPQPLDMMIDTASGRVTIRYTDDGKPKIDSERMELTPDLANGLILTLLKNFRTGAKLNKLSFIAATPKARLVKLAINDAGEEAFVTGGASRKAIHYVLKVELGGISGVLAPIVGKQPPDSHVWILAGEAPAFIKSEQPLYADGPTWRIELVAPRWP